MESYGHKWNEAYASRVLSLYGIAGASVPEVAEYLEISESTLRKYYSNELRIARMEKNEAVAKALFERATIDRDVSAQKFWLQCRGQWREKDKTDTAQSLNEMLIKKLLSE